ncbi:hypothetical protein MASR1M8_16850 [Thermomonas brevis]
MNAVRGAALRCALACAIVVSLPACASGPQAVTAAAPEAVSLVQRTGADERGMRRYVLVVLKTGPTPVQDAEARKAMFAGHFANMQRWSEAGKLVLAGPFMQDADGWRGLYVFAVADKAEARALAETDPVVAGGEMVAEYHDWYGSAALVLLPGQHAELERQAKPAAD